MTDINKAIRLLQAGEIVALPTETVYGLAGNSLNPAAIAKIFAAKNRPQDNPLIVHVSDMEMVETLGLEIPDIARRLAERFWAGPLTMVLKKTENIIPSEISCGLDSVAVRMPDSPIMLEIIRKCGFPLAAPSANLSGSPSPTAAQHVYEDLNGRIPLIVDGGACEVGIESTVIMFSDGQIKILRPGVITAEDLRDFAEIVVEDVGAVTCRPLSPGTKYKHYSPRAEVIPVDGELPDHPFTIENPTTQNLFAKFREFDEMGATEIYVKLPKKSGVGLALYNRIMKAAGL